MGLSNSNRRTGGPPCAMPRGFSLHALEYSSEILQSGKKVSLRGASWRFPGCDRLLHYIKGLLEDPEGAIAPPLAAPPRAGKMLQIGIGSGPDGRCRRAR